MASKDKEKTPYDDEVVDDGDESDEINREASGESGDEAVSEQPGTEDEDAEEDVSLCVCCSRGARARSLSLACARVRRKRGAR
jgi:hypothetical protein